jgi:hypothetical protein
MTEGIDPRLVSFAAHAFSGLGAFAHRLGGYAPSRQRTRFSGDHVFSLRPQAWPWNQVAVAVAVGLFGFACTGLARSAQSRPPSPASVGLGFALMLISVSIIASARIGYVMFVSANDAGEGPTAECPRECSARASGLVPDNWRRCVWLRDETGTLRRSGSGSTESLTMIWTGFPGLEIESRASLEAVRGTVFTLTTARPAISVPGPCGRLVLGFDDVSTRDGWVELLTSGH